MGRKFIALAAAVVIPVLAPLSGQAQNPGGGHHHKGGGPSPGGNFNMGRARYRSLSPEDRMRFSRNAERWMKMSPQERAIMREREVLRRQRIKQEAQAALRDSGLQLDAQKQAQFEARYLQERTRVEHLMRQELEAKRKQEVPALVDQLKKEFQTEQGGAGTGPSPSASPKPKK